jgi:hypothetical protein
MAREGQEASMNEDALNISVRKFLKKVGVVNSLAIVTP